VEGLAPAGPSFFFYAGRFEIDGGSDLKCKKIANIALMV
jgi:hypothetical protein